MSWDLTIRSADGNLGNFDAVRGALSRIFPTASFGSEPSGIEKIRAAEAQGIKFPDFLRENMLLQPAKHGADFEADGVSFRFHFGSEDTVQKIHVEVRGTGDPFPLLRQLAVVKGWLVIDDATGGALTESSQPAQTGWAKYQKLIAEVENQG